MSKLWENYFFHGLDFSINSKVISMLFKYKIKVNYCLKKKEIETQKRKAFLNSMHELIKVFFCSSFIYLNFFTFSPYFQKFLYFFCRFNDNNDIIKTIRIWNIETKHNFIEIYWALNFDNFLIIDMFNEKIIAQKVLITEKKVKHYL
jgi:hypothetical protein